MMTDEVEKNLGGSGCGLLLFFLLYLGLSG
jgi:hypothetical protein